MTVQSKPNIESEHKPKRSVCSSCFSSIGSGLPHHCGKTTAVSNLIVLAFSLGSLQAEQVAAGILKKKMEDEQILDGSEFRISTGGNPLRVKVGTPNNKNARRSVKQISVQVIKELQIVLELSMNKTKQMITVLRKGMDMRSSVESNVLGKLQEIEESISGFYHVEKVHLNLTWNPLFIIII
jgi:hypothetical protein